MNRTQVFGAIVIRALAVVFLIAFSGGCYAMSGGGQHFRVSNPASAFLACHEVASGLEGRVLELMAYASDEDMPSPAIDRAIRDAAAARVRATEVLIVLVRELQRAGYHLTEVRCP